MIEALEPLADLPGVELVMLVTKDGVPIAVPGQAAKQVLEGDDPPPFAAMGKEDAIAAIATGWLNDLGQAVSPLSWDEPSRIVMRCERGVLVMHSTRSAVLLVLLARGLSPEDVRLSMDGTVARIERGLRGMGRGTTPAPPSSPRAAEAPQQWNTHPPGPIPTKDLSRRGEGLAQTTNHGKRTDLTGQ